MRACNYRTAGAEKNRHRTGCKAIGYVLPCLALLTALSMAGCAVGPDFKKPAASKVTAYLPQPLTATVATSGVPGGQAQHFVVGRDISGQWWTLFHSQALNGLIQRALAHNPDLQAARAALKAAREDVLAQRGTYYPSISAGFSASREQDPAAALAPVPANNTFLYDLFTPQVSVAYAPDVFGLNRRNVESLKAQAQAVRFQQIAAYNTLTANVVVAAIESASLKAQIDATTKLVNSGSQMVRILRYQLSKGYASRLDVAAQESQLAQIRATLPPLRKQLAQTRDLLAVLTGGFPNQASQPAFKLSSLRLPVDLPVSLPSKLVAQRPDVRQAEANWHDASARVGIAIANRLPNIQLTADAGSTALAISKIFASGTGFWGLGVAVLMPLFEGGTLLHQERAAKAACVEAAAQYRSTVLTAFQNVADTLAALQQDADGLKAAAAAAKAAKVTLDLSRRQAHDGYASYLSLLNAEQTYQQAEISLIQAEAARFADTAALFQALGGGWWHRSAMAQNQ